MKLLLILFALAGWSPLCFGGEEPFAVSRIPPALLKNANAVVRVDEQKFEFVNTTKTFERNRFVVTVLNEKGASLAEFEQSYDKLRKLQSVEGFLYDAGGRQLARMKTKDAEDISGVSGSNLFDDDRIKRFSFSHRQYPYTVEFIYEMEMNYTLFFPSWYAQPGEHISVEKTSFEVRSPVDYPFRFKAYNYKNDPEVTVNGKTKITTWKLEHLEAFATEPYSPPFYEMTPMVMLAPTAFRVGDYSGNMATWKDFGKFVYALKQGRDELPEQVTARVRELISGVPDKVSRVRALYQFLQKNTRYINVSLGIGGWQPFDAKYVASKSYGDCKALSNYMYALLKAADIRSHYAVVRAGRNQTALHSDFPSQQFNHVILCVPLEKDTMWLECTSQTLPAGYLGDHTNNRPALIVEADGGQLVMTKQYEASENLQARSIQAVLDEEGSLRLKAVTRFTGLQMDGVHQFINSLSREHIGEYLQRELEFATYEVSKFNYSEESGSDPVVNESLDIIVGNYGTFTGKRLFILPNVMNRRSVKLPATESRKFDIELHQGWLDTDSVTIEIPEGFVAESLPANSQIRSVFGEYDSRVVVEGNRIKYHRRLLYLGGRHPAATYNELVKFNEQIHKADRARLVLVRNQ